MSIWLHKFQQYEKLYNGEIALQMLCRRDGLTLDNLSTYFPGITLSTYRRSDFPNSIGWDQLYHIEQPVDSLEFYNFYQTLLNQKIVKLEDLDARDLDKHIDWSNPDVMNTILDAPVTPTSMAHVAKGQQRFVIALARKLGEPDLRAWDLLENAHIILDHYRYVLLNDNTMSATSLKNIMSHVAQFTAVDWHERPFARSALGLFVESSLNHLTHKKGMQLLHTYAPHIENPEVFSTVRIKQIIEDPTLVVKLENATIWHQYLSHEMAAHRTIQNEMAQHYWGFYQKNEGSPYFLWKYHAMWSPEQQADPLWQQEVRKNHLTAIHNGLTTSTKISDLPPLLREHVLVELSQEDDDTLRQKDWVQFCGVRLDNPTSFKKCIQQHAPQLMTWWSACDALDIPRTERHQHFNVPAPSIDLNNFNHDAFNPTHS